METFFQFSERYLSRVLVIENWASMCFTKMYLDVLILSSLILRDSQSISIILQNSLYISQKRKIKLLWDISRNRSRNHENSSIEMVVPTNSTLLGDRSFSLFNKTLNGLSNMVSFEIWDSRTRAFIGFKTFASHFGLTFHFGFWQHGFFRQRFLPSVD